MWCTSGCGGWGEAGEERDWDRIQCARQARTYAYAPAALDPPKSVAPAGRHCPLTALRSSNTRLVRHAQRGIAPSDSAPRDPGRSRPLPRRDAGHSDLVPWRTFSVLGDNLTRDG